ncbi:hypothetical protein [Kribbella sp. NPDC051770]|uniref:hypothetical protein n=1 Tax=Kribbella sp. NPDC051770 TaxID=3155413 RepID=UPI0034357192
MARRVLATLDGKAFDLVETPAESEHSLQEIVKQHPQLIPAEDLGLDGDLLVLGRETTLQSGAIDLLCLAKSGDLVLVEFKTGPQNPDFRAALAQLIDYGSDLWGMTLEDFDRGVVQRYLTSQHATAEYKSANGLDDAISRTGWKLGDEELESLRTRLADVLLSGDFKFVVAAQRFTAAMSKSLDYLNSTARFGRYYLVQVIKLAGNQLSAYSAQVVAGTAVTRPLGATGRMNETDFLAAATDDVYRDALADLFSTVKALGLAMSWGTRGVSIRIKTPDRVEPLSIGWVFHGLGWNTTRDVTFGVDPQSMKGTPTVEPLVDAFVAEMAKVSRARKVPGQLQAYSFGPTEFIQAQPSIVAGMERLVESVRELPVDG